MKKTYLILFIFSFFCICLSLYQLFNMSINMVASMTRFSDGYADKISIINSAIEDEDKIQVIKKYGERNKDSFYKKSELESLKKDSSRIGYKIRLSNSSINDISKTFGFEIKEDDRFMGLDSYKIRKNMYSLLFLICLSILGLSTYKLVKAYMFNSKNKPIND
jgi:hypothetical protein